VFNAIAWKEGYRFFGCSQDLLKALRRPKKDNSVYTWLCISLHYDDLGMKRIKSFEKILCGNNTIKKIWV
jgi:hypothetical protein